jgi:hypothetical protein
MFKIKMAAKSFEADLPELNEDQLCKLYKWGQTSCEKCDVRMNRDMTLLLVASRKKAGSVRDHMRLLRTNLINWGVALPMKQAGWLRIIPEDGVASQGDRGANEAQPASGSQKEIMRNTTGHSLLKLPESFLTIPIQSH